LRATARGKTQESGTSHDDRASSNDSEHVDCLPEITAGELNKFSASCSDTGHSQLVWPRICRNLGLRDSSRATPKSAAPWQALAAASAVAAIILGGGWWASISRPPVTVTETVIERIPESVTVALVGNIEGEPIWLTRIRPDSGELTVRVLHAPEQTIETDYQLWLLTSDGTPLSMGLMPQSGEQTLALNDNVVSAIGGSTTVAVSLEPRGGSPMSVPSGPVLFTAALLP
jgi:anti-sigma-K factor RskA